MPAIILTNTGLLLLVFCAAVAQDCSQPCNCPTEAAPCPVGTSLVLDGCGCCKVCARQMGEPCSLWEPCDHHKDLYCDYTALSDSTPAICMARGGQTCDLGGVVYRSGEAFQPSCKHQCICMSGEIGCVPTCPSDVRLPSPQCPAPRRITIPGQCCEEWACDSAPQGLPFQAVMAGMSRKTYREADYRAGPESARDNCIVQTTTWSDCSTSCGMGISTRVTNDNQHCQLEKQNRFCLIRPCHAHQESAIRRGKRCVRTPRSPRPVRFSVSGCRSVRGYRLRFCGVCTDGRCCRPQTSVTAEVEFRCPEGDIRRKMMFIRTCSCHLDCPRDNDIFHSTHLRPMSGDYDINM
ncbi:CCN family member 2b isoform X1 [Anguilla anguilla]|uniref:CCN family member 2b isoform X1 n=1 Tax=Anguilla anguilla TaxID=7936 RepID=UPI0015AEFA81|nr:CCN family member 2b isoform X1 [Anguilla anguilla]